MPDSAMLDAKTDQQLLTELVNEVFRLNGALLAAGDTLSAPFGLTAARWQVLGFVADGPCSAAELARRRGLRRQSVQESVNKLLAQDLIERRPNPADARAPLLSLTPKANMALEGLNRSQHTWASALAAQQHRQGLETALAVLQTLRETLEER